MLGAGKGTVAGYLVKEKGFKHYSARDFFTEEVLRRGLVVNRDSLVLIANDLRKKHGPGHVAEQLYERAARDGGDAVIESLRCLGEVDLLRKKGDFVLFGVDADPETRYARIIERGSATDNISFDKFVAHEQREAAQSDPTKGNIRGCVDVADYVFRNDWTVEELHKKVEAVLVEIKGEKEAEDAYNRPSWDEYFMNICHEVARRGTCSRGRTACVFVKNKHILVTGYVGAPKGLPHCDKVGHQMENTIHGDGVERAHCVRTSHAEQNAICQAAKLGIPIEGSTVYCKMEPCSVCAKMIINCGVRRVVCEKRYQSGARSLLEEAGVRVDVLNDEVVKY